MKTKLCSRIIDVLTIYKLQLNIGQADAHFLNIKLLVFNLKHLHLGHIFLKNKPKNYVAC